jgi:hypothetical protein
MKFVKDICIFTSKINLMIIIVEILVLYSSLILVLVQQDFHDSRLGRPFGKAYEQESYGKEDVLFAVEKCMKKYADNLLRSLEGITNRLSQLEIYCYKLERSMGELRSDVLRDETDQRLKSLEKHLHEVSKSLF